MKTPQMFAQITKVDEASRTVTARAAQEVPDLSGEIMDYATTKPYFEEWSRETAAASAGKSLGNIRSMHTNIAAGKAIGIEFNDAESAIDLKFKVVDDQEWTKVLEGVYTGLSMGGTYVKQWQDATNPELTRYTANPHEVSLVDKPCIPTALFFDVHKADGSTLRKSFALKDVAPQPEDTLEAAAELSVEKVVAVEAPAVEAPAVEAPAVEETPVEKNITGTPEEVGALLDMITTSGLDAKATTDTLGKALRWDSYSKVTFADEAAKRFPLDTTAQVKAAMYHIDTDAAKAAYTDADAYAKVRETIAAAYAAKVGEAAPEVGKAAKPELQKSFYVIEDLARVTQSLVWMLPTLEWEADLLGGDAETLSDAFRTATLAIATLVSQFAALEAAALTGEPDADNGPGALMALSASAGDLVKAAKSPTEKGLQKMHDMCAKLGAKCAAGDAEKVAEVELEKAAAPEMDKHTHGADVEKLMGDNAALAKRLDELAASFAKLSKEPVPTRVVLKAVPRTADVVSDTQQPNTHVEPVKADTSGVNAVATAIKGVHLGGGAPLLSKM
jgi:hypothetical protein